jgi:serine/threonine protein phosphatase PrpC
MLTHAVDRSGATATVGLYKDGLLLVAGLGDTKAVLLGPEKSSRIETLTTRHNPYDALERFPHLPSPILSNAASRMLTYAEH